MERGRHMNVLEALMRLSLERAGSHMLREVRIGLGYTCAVVSGDGETSAGLAATVLEDVSPTCTRHRRAGRLAGSSLDDVLSHEPESCVERAVVLACCNAVLNKGFFPQDTIDLVGELSGKDVGMVGLFAPLIPELKRAARSLVVVERNEARISEGVERDIDALSKCDVVVVSSSTIVNGTVDEVLSACEQDIVMLGPSTPMSFLAFPERVSMLAGRVVLDIEGALRVVSEGGGTPALSRCTKKLTLKR